MILCDSWMIVEYLIVKPWGSPELSKINTKKHAEFLFSRRTPNKLCHGSNCPSSTDPGPGVRFNRERDKAYALNSGVQQAWLGTPFPAGSGPPRETQGQYL